MNPAAPTDRMNRARPAAGHAPRPTLTALFAAQVARTPDAVALRQGGQELSYTDLERRSAVLAARIAAELPGPDRVVAVAAERSVDLVVALLAVVRAGGAYLAIDPADPPARVRQILADADPAAVVTTARLRRRLPRTGCPVLSLEGDRRPVPSAPLWTVEPDHLAYVSYTSGSTGRPKGVCVPHRAVARLVVSPDWMGWTERDTFLQLAPVAFDASTLEIWAPLTSGATLAVAPPGPATPDAVAAAVRAERVTVLWLTAGLFHSVVDDHIDSLGGLRHLLAGGDVVSATHVARLTRRHPRLRFTNGYGPTENTTFTTCWTAGQDFAEPIVPIGRPISGTRAMILDGDLAPVPPGAVGELYAAGDGLARGYLRRPSQTALRFLPDPDPAHPGERMYRTGDLARRRPDGEIQFVGRADAQVKINGFRVEPGEVEAVVRGLPGVGDAAVSVHSGSNGRRQLAAYVVPDRDGTAGRELTPSAVVETLRTLLPAYLVPSAVVPLTALPLTGNGKIDRAALPAPVAAPRDVSTPYVPARTGLEVRLVEVWQRALAVEPVGVDDDFFELGGHSLLAAELVRDIQHTLGIDFPAQTLYLRPTVAELARSIEERSAAG